MIEYETQPLIQEGTSSTGSTVSNFRELRVGAGDNMFGFTGEGGWIGASSFQNANTKFDYLNKRILINDGTNDRILMGLLSGGF